MSSTTSSATLACAFRYYPKARGVPTLCMHGITTEGKKVFISLSASAAESFDNWHAHLPDH